MSGRGAAEHEPTPGTAGPERPQSGAAATGRTPEPASTPGTADPERPSGGAPEPTAAGERGTGGWRSLAGESDGSEQPARDVPAAPDDAGEEEPPARPRFPSFVDRVAAMVEQEGIDEDLVIPRISLMMRKLHQLMTDDATQQVYRPAGWSHAGFRICIALWVMGPMASHQVTAMTNMGRATVSAALKRISEEGLVTKEPSTDDLRSVQVRLTPEGEARIRESYAVHLRLEHEWFDVLTEAEKHMLLILLEKLTTDRPRR